MKWGMKDPAPGDMIRVPLGGIYHYGIYVSDEEVIQFGLAPSRQNLLRDSEVEVLASDIDAFLAGGFLEVCEFDRKERKKNRSPEQVIAFARSKIGMRGYHILYNNCEHFATECVTGVAVCRQAEDVRAMFRNMPVVDVYLATLPDREIGEPLRCALRQQEIDGLTNERVRREKYYVWKLLAYGLERSLGIKIADCAFTKDESGRYMTDGVEFSLSHSKNALAVAVSRAPVGVDIEPIKQERCEELAARAMTERELATFREAPEGERPLRFTKAWTAKEALFKASHGQRFEPASWNTETGSFRSYEITVGESACVLSVATETPERIKLYENIKL